MKKRILIAVLALLLVVGALAVVKVLQIRAMVESAKNAAPPPDNVTVAAVKTEVWETYLTSVGSLVAVQGVTVAAEVPGKIVEIAFEAGSRVRKGDLLVRQDTDVEEAQLAGAEAREKLAGTVLARNEEMLKGKIVSQVVYDESVANLRESAAQVNSLRATIGKKAIRAPFGGRLGIRQVNLGQILEAGTPVVTLQSLDPIHVDFTLPQQDMSVLRLGLPVRIANDAAPGKKFKGRITTISPLVDAETRNIQVQATMENREERLRPGMYADVTLVLPVRKQVRIIPETAVLHAPYGSSVFVVEDDAKGKGGKVLRQQFARLGERRGDFVAVLEGVKDGESVVTTGVFKLRNGQAVQIDNRLSPEFRIAPRPENR